MRAYHGTIPDIKPTDLREGPCFPDMSPWLPVGFPDTGRLGSVLGGRGNSPIRGKGSRDLRTQGGGIAVSIGARIGALAGQSEVLVSSTVKDLVAGSGLSFVDRGEHELKGVPDRWRLYAVTGAVTT